VGPGFGTHGGALATAGAAGGIDVAGFVAHRGGKVAGLAIEVEEVGVGQEMEKGMEVTFEGGAEGRLVGQHEAQAAGVGGEGVVEEVHRATDGRSRVEQMDGDALLGEVQRGGHAGNAGAHDEHRGVWLAGRRDHEPFISYKSPREERRGLGLTRCRVRTLCMGRSKARAISSVK
jgi:hypothetical protein